MVSKLNKFRKDENGVSPVIGVILLVAVAVALLVLVSVLVFNIGTDSGNESADASIDFSQTSSGVSVQVVSNNNVEEFIIQFPDGTSETLSGNVGSSTNLVGPEGQYNVVAVLPDGEEQVILTRNVEGLDYSGVFIVTQDEEEGEVEAELRQQFDNIDDYDLSVLVDDEDDSQLTSSNYIYDESLLSESLLNDGVPERVQERIDLLQITINEIDPEDENTFSVGERIAIHEMTNLCPGDTLALEDSSDSSVLTQEEITIETDDCNDIRQVAIYKDGKMEYVELINLWNQDSDYFVFDFEGSFNPEMPKTATPIDEKDGTLVRISVLEEGSGDELEGATVHLGNLTESTNDTGVAEFENVQQDAGDLEAVAYKDGYQPSDIEEFEIIDPDDNPQDEELVLELAPIDEEPVSVSQRNTSDGDNRVPVSGGGGTTIGTFGGGGGGGAISGGGGGTFSGGSGAFYGFAGSTGASTTTLSSSAPTSSPDEVNEIVQPERVFNVQEIDDSLIPQGGEFRVEAGVTSTGPNDLQDRVVVYKSPLGEDTRTEIGNESVTLPGGDDTNVHSQDFVVEPNGEVNWDEGEYNIYASLNSSSNMQSAGILNVFPDDRLDATVDTSAVDVDIETELEESDRARVGDSVTITVSSAALDGTDSATVDLFKNGKRVDSQVVNSDLEYTETFESAQYAQFHIGIQESQSVSLLDTLVVTDVVESSDIDTYETNVDINEANSACLGDDIGTSGQFDCQVDIGEDSEDGSEVEFTAEGSEFELASDSDFDEFESISYEWRFGEENTETFDELGEAETVSHEFETDTVHLVEFVVDAKLDGEEYSDRSSVVVNAVENPDEIATRIIDSNVDDGNNVTVDIENDRKTIDEEVTLEFVKIDGEEDVKFTDTFTVRSDSSVEYRETIDNVSEYTEDEELEDEIDFEIRLTSTEEGTQFRDESVRTETLTVPEASLDASISGFIEILE